MSCHATTFVAAFLMVTVAPGRTAPVPSETVPANEAVKVCASTVAAPTNGSTQTRSHGREYLTSVMTYHPCHGETEWKFLWEGLYRQSRRDVNCSITLNSRARSPTAPDAPGCACVVIVPKMNYLSA